MFDPDVALEPVTLRTVGILVARNKTYLTVVRDQQEDGQVRAGLSIPQKNVLRFRVLR
jgi:hypothetical protein